MKLFRKKASLAAFSLVLSLYTLAAFHVPFFSHALQRIEGGFNGVLIIATAAILLLCMDYLLYYLLAWLGRMVGRCIICLTLVGDAVMLFGVNAYDVLVTDEMMGNVLNTQYSEVSGFFSWEPVLYILLLGVLPGVAAVILDSVWVLLFSAVMLMSAGGDLLIARLLLRHRVTGDALYFDHPTKIGLACFEK